MDTLKTIKSNAGRKAREKGYKTEGLVVAYLMLKGYSILERNFKVGKGLGCGEIDIIAFKAKTIAFIEVKRRKSLDLSADAVTLKNKQRVTKSAEYFLSLHPEYNDFGVRFDAVLVNNLGIPFHIKDAWRPEWW